MKEDQQSTLTRAETTVSWRRPVDHLLESKLLHDQVTVSSADELQTRTSRIILLFLDLARPTGDTASLDLAKPGAKDLADTWEKPAANPTVIQAAGNPSFTHGLSRAAFALAEAWKVTQNPLYRDAGLKIIWYLAEKESAAGRGLDAVHRGERGEKREKR